MKIIPKPNRWSGREFFFLRKNAQSRNRSVQQKGRREARWRPLAVFPLLPMLLLFIVSGAIPSDLWRAAGRPIDLTVQDDRERGSATGFTTGPQKVEWRVNGQVITGQATLTFLEAHAEDDTLRANLSVTEVHHSSPVKSPKQPEKRLAPFTQEIRAHWRKGTSCPTLHLRIPAFELPAGSGPLPIPSFDLKVEETQAEVPQLLCSWTRQINAGRSRLGILRALNRILLPPSEGSLPPHTSSSESIGDLDF